MQTALVIVAAYAVFFVLVGLAIFLGVRRYGRSEELEDPGEPRDVPFPAELANVDELGRYTGAPLPVEQSPDLPVSPFKVVCPSCGEVLKAWTVRCPACGVEVLV